MADLPPSPTGQAPAPRRPALRAAALLVCLPPALQEPAADPRPPQGAIDAAIANGSEFLRASIDGELEALRRDGLRPYLPPRSVRAGERALVAYTLLKAGAAAEDELVTRIVAGLAFEEIEHTYDVACTLLLLEEHDATAHRAWIEELARALVDWQEEGDWGYPVGSDLSNTQFAALGLWAAARAGVDVGAAPWRALADALPRYRASDGGFAYHAGGSGSGSMTAAGVGTLALCETELARLGALEAARAEELRDARTAGLEWLAEVFRADENPRAASWTYYWLYGLERMATFTGIQRVGAHDWYGAGAAWLVATQGEQGQWQGRIETSFAVLFLARAALSSIAPRTGVEAWAASSKDADVRLEAHVAGERVAFRVLGFARRAAAPLEGPNEAGRGPRVLRVEYSVGRRVVAVALGDALEPARGALFPASARLPAGRHAIRARAWVLARLPLDGGRRWTETTRALDSAMVTVTVEHGAPARAEAEPENLIPRAPMRIQARASSVCPSVEGFPHFDFGPERAIDGKPRRPWLARPDDQAPELRLSFAKRLRADRVRIVPPRLAGFPADELGRPFEVEVVVNGNVVGRTLVPPDPSRAATLLFGEPLAVSSLTVRILAGVPGRRTAAVGLGEVELALGQDG